MSTSPQSLIRAELEEGPTIEVAGAEASAGFTVRARGSSKDRESVSSSDKGSDEKGEDAEGGVEQYYETIREEPGASEYVTQTVIFEHESTDEEAHSPEALEFEDYGMDYKKSKGTAAGQ